MCITPEWPHMLFLLDAHKMIARLIAGVRGDWQHAMMHTF